jgi:hypothetical protein
VLAADLRLGLPPALSISFMISPPVDVAEVAAAR